MKGGEPAADHRNNFDATRLFAAFLVIYGHQLQMRGIAVPTPFGVPVSKTGLDIFFSLSGYLVAGSWQRDPDLPRFLLRRVLRILPALAAVVGLTAFVLGPLVSALPLREYLARAGTYGYLLNVALLMHNRLPGVFTGQFGQSVNGSLWSLFPEFLCYLTVPLFGLLPRRPRAFALVSGAVAVGVIGYQLIDASRVITVYGADLRFVLVEVCFFWGGALLKLLDAGRTAFYRLDAVILLCAVRTVLSVTQGQLALVLDPLLMPYLVIAFGRARTPWLHRASRFGDLSYGFYLYAFPLQQLALYLHLPHPLPCALAATAAAAWLSWHVVEQPALRLKPAR